MKRPLPLALLLALFWWMATSVSPRMGATADERLHLAGGYSYWTLNDYRLQPENGNLTMRLQALPLLPMSLQFPPIQSDTLLHGARGSDVAHNFLFSLGNPFTDMLWRARAITALLSLLTLTLVWQWTRKLFGATAGWLAVVVAMFCPTLLAHSGLATSDAAMTAGFVASVSACWWLLHRTTPLRIALGGVAVGAALLAKFSAVMLVPMAALLLLVRWLRPAPFVVVVGRRVWWLRGRGKIVAGTLAVTVATGLVALVVVWSAYGFRYRALNPRFVSAGAPASLDWDYQTRLLSRGPGQITGAGITWAREHKVLPEAWLFGFADSYTGSRNRPAFLMGEVSTTGWPQFFPLAFLLKTPPTLLLLFLAGVAALIVKHARPSVAASPRWPRRGWLYRSTPLLALFVVYWGVALNTPLNIGHRHLLPTYPALYVAAGAAAGWIVLTGPRWAAVVFIVGATLAHAVDSWTARPFYLSYFSPWVGGSARGWHYLVDSSLDWGQGLPDLSEWIARKEARGDREPVFLTYFGTDSPDARHLPVTRFGDLVRDLEPRSYPAQVRGGWFVIGATHFQRYYLGLAGPWNSVRERAYQELFAKLRAAPADLASRPEMERRPWADAARTFETLQFARLCHFLGDRPPVEFIGGSLLVFHLTDAEVQRALYGPWMGAPVKPR